MRSLFSFGASKEMSLAIAGTGHRPEILRRQTLANNSRIAIGLSAACMPMAVYGLVSGITLLFVLAAIGLGSGIVTLSLHQRRLYEHAAAGQVYTIILMGLLLTIADGQLVDAGLGITLMAPVLAALLGRAELRRNSWLMVVGVAVVGILCGVVAIAPLAMQPQFMPLAAMLVFLFSAGVVLHSAHRIGAAYEMFDKAQMAAYRHLIEHVQDAVFRFSADGEMLMASQSSETLFGCRRYQLTGSGLAERVHVADRPAYLTAFAQANVDGKTRTVQVRMRRDEPGSSSNVPRFIWVEVSLRPVIEHAATGQHYEVLALLRDITDQKDNEATMVAARRTAEEASEAKSRFLATIGHELRTPLNAVVGFSEMMTSSIGGELSDTHREYAGLIHQSGKHLLEVVRMLLDMSRIEAGKFELQTEPFALRDIVEPCLGMVDALATQRDVRIVTDISAQLPLLTGDERACRQVLLNLLSNAVKFSHPGGTVTLTMKRQGTAINMSVADQGIGMAPESLQRIGEAFFQAQSGHTRGYEGTGLGLSIVKGLVDLHDGTLRAISEIGAGTTITVLLPINGPAINSDQTATVTTLHPEPAAAPTSSWQDEKRKAQ